MPSKQAVAEFKTLYQQHYGVVLTDDEAFEKSTRLLCLYKAVFIPNMKMNPDEKTSQPSIYPR